MISFSMSGNRSSHVSASCGASAGRSLCRYPGSTLDSVCAFPDVLQVVRHIVHHLFGPLAELGGIHVFLFRGLEEESVWWCQIQVKVKKLYSTSEMKSRKKWSWQPERQIAYESSWLPVRYIFKQTQTSATPHNCTKTKAKIIRSLRYTLALWANWNSMLSW